MTDGKAKYFRLIEGKSDDDIAREKWIVSSTKHLNTLDCSEFSIGCPIPPKSQNLAERWIPYSGRPKLIGELLPYIRLELANKASATYNSWRAAFRGVWRMLDIIDPERYIDTVAKLTEVHGALQYRMNFSSDHVNVFMRVVNRAREDLHLPKLFWLRADRPTKITDVPELHHVKAVQSEIKTRIKLIISRWEQADALAAQGVVRFDALQGQEKRLKVWTEADHHATFRHLQSSLSMACPTINVIDSTYGRCKIFNRGVRKSMHGLYPSFMDVQAFYLLFVSRSGWNPAVVLAIDMDDIDQTIVPHPTSDEHHIVYSVKERAGGSSQFSMGLNKSLFSVGGLLRTIYERSKPLREELRRRLKAEMATPWSKAAEHRIIKLRELIRSPWLFVMEATGEISALSDANYLRAAPEVRGERRQPAMMAIINAINARSKGNDKIPYFTVTDFRDALISYVYEASGYDWLVAKLVAGHKSTESLKAYFRKRRWKIDGERKVSRWQNALWREIIERRVVDSAVLYALVQRGEISETQRLRWSQFKDRTRVGMGCKSFKTPPKRLDPAHVNGRGCRSQRCTLCEHGIVFDDSLSLLACRAAELYELRTTLPVLTWNQSTFPDELEATMATLQFNFNSAEVSAEIEAWKERIQSGQHIPVYFGGEYGA